MRSILVIGAGYSGERIARNYAALGHPVTATRRNQQPDENGIHWLALDLDAPRQLPAADMVFYTAPPARSGETDYRLSHLLEVLPPPKVFVYFSATSVYGDYEGDWVDESAPVAPGTYRGRLRADAERQVQSWCLRHACVPVILRIAAIYGPGRLPLERLKAREPVIDPAEAGLTNRIHVDDLVTAAVVAADAGEPRVLNIADGHPSTLADYLDELAALTGLPKPPRISRAEAGLRLPESQLSFLRESKHVDNARLLALPGFHLKYPDYRAGLRASLPESLS